MKPEIVDIPPNSVIQSPLWNELIEHAKHLPLDKCIVVPLEGNSSYRVATRLHNALKKRGLAKELRAIQRNRIVYIARRAAVPDSK